MASRKTLICILVLSIYAMSSHYARAEAPRNYYILDDPEMSEIWDQATLGRTSHSSSTTHPSALMRRRLWQTGPLLSNRSCMLLLA